MKTIIPGIFELLSEASIDSISHEKSKNSRGMCEDMIANIDELSSTPDRETHLLFLVVCSTLVLGQNKSFCANQTNGSGRQEKTMSALLD